MLTLPILKELIPEGIEFGTALLIEFAPDSIWHEASLTMAAQALREGVRTAYHTFQHPPDETRRALTRLGLDVKKLENDRTLVILDSYTAQTGLGLQGRDNSAFQWDSLKVSDWSIEGSQTIKAGVPEARKRRLHIDDNLGILLQYNPEKVLIDWWRTRLILEERAYESVGLHSVVTGIASDAFYRQIEQSCDGIIDFKNEEKGAEIEQYIRVRILRGKRYNSRWRRLSQLDEGEVALAD